MKSPVAAPLQIDNFTTGSVFLNRLPMAFPGAAATELSRFIDSLIDCPPNVDDLFQLLEQARLPLFFVTEELARQLHNKALPLAAPEEQVFQQTLATWQKMARAYALCAERGHAEPSDPAYALHIATILQRCIYYTGALILEHFRVRRELPAGLWLSLHGYFATAEEWGVANLPVNDALDHEQPTTHCTATYLTLILVDAASPYSRSVRDLNLIRRWACRWAPLVSLSKITDDIIVPPYVIELMQDSGIHPTAYEVFSGADTRQLDTSRLSLQIQQTLAQLRQHITPAQLGLGEETTSHVTKLLQQISQPWSQTAAARRFRRFASTAQANLTSGFDSIYFHITGANFEQSDSASAYSRSQFDTLFTFRHQAEPATQASLRTPIAHLFDQWDILNHSAQGFRLARNSPGQPLTHGQLLAICSDDSSGFLLAQASWLMQEVTGGLITGLSLFPGLPSGVGIRPCRRDRFSNERFSPAFLLPSLAAINEEPSLIIPAGMYQASQLLEIVDGPLIQVKMKSLLQRGCDFERISFEKI